MRKILALLLTLLAPGALAQTSVRQSGNVTPGHVPMWTTTGVIQDGGTAVQGFLTSIGVTAQGPAICQNSAPITAPYNRLCLSVSTSSAAQIILQNLGGAAAQPLQFVINGTTYDFPGPGNGDVIGPAGATNNSVAVFNGTTGKSIKSSPAFTLFPDSGVNQIFWNSLGTASLTVGDPTSCTSNLCAGGILAQRVSGDHQTVSAQLLPVLDPTYLPPAWGPVTEFVTYRYLNAGNTDYQRWSFTGMSAWADPSETVVANDFRFQGESGGAKDMAPMKVTNQNNTSGAGYEHLWFGSSDGVTVDGNIRVFPSRFFPAVSSANLAMILGQYKSSNGPTIITPSIQESPAIWWQGNSVQSSDNASFTGTISGTTLTFPSATGTVAIGQTVYGVNVITDTIITGGSGLSWTVSKSQTVASESMTSTLVKYPTFQARNVPTTNAGAQCFHLQSQLSPTSTSSGWTDRFVSCTAADTVINVPTGQALELSVNGAIIYVGNASALFPNDDNQRALGGASNRYTSVYATSYFAGAAVAGVSCSGTPTSSFASVNGIVTHC